METDLARRVGAPAQPITAPTHVYFRKAGAGFGIAKATEGLNYVDDQFWANWAMIKGAGIPVRGAYHFGHPGKSATDQAAHFVKAVGEVGDGDFLVLDIESATAPLRASGNWSAAAQADVAGWCLSFVQAVMQLAKVGKNRVWLYTGEWFWDPSTTGSAALADHPLWLSGYVPSDPPMPKGWSSYTMWQYTDKASWRGVNGPCDSSVFSGTQAELEAMLRGGAGAATGAGTPCCVGACRPPLKKFYSVDQVHNMCGECCMNPTKVTLCSLSTRIVFLSQSN